MVVFAPHPDDETFGCGGTITKKINEGYTVIVVVITDGRHLFQKILGIDEDPAPEEVKRMRKEEVIRATKWLEVPNKNLLFFDFEDGMLEKHEDDVEKRIVEIMDKYSPAEVYFPYIGDGHPDHRATNQIVKRSLQETGLTPKKYQYSIRHRHSRVGPLIDRALSLFRRNMIKVDVSKFLNFKEKAVKEFKSEFSIVSSKQEKPLDDKIDKYLRKYEIFYVDK